MFFFDDDGFQNMFVHQPTFNTLELKERKSTEHVVGCISKGLFKSKLFPIHGAFLPNIKYFKYNIGIQFNNTLLIVQLINHTTEAVNDYIVYDFANWPKLPFRKIYIKNVFNMIAKIYEAKTLIKHISCSFKYRFSSATYNSNQKWNNDKCQCECTKYITYKKDQIWNPSTCICENSINKVLLKNQ